MGARKDTPPDPDVLAESFSKLRAAERDQRLPRSLFRDQKSKSFCIKMPSEMAVRLIAWANEEHVSPQEIIRRLISVALEDDTK